MDRSYSEYQTSIYKIPPILFGQLVSSQSHIGNPSNVVISRVLSFFVNHPYEVSYLGESRTLLTFTIHMYLLHSQCPSYQMTAVVIKKCFNTKKIRQTKRIWFCILLNNKKVRHMVAELDKEEHSKKTDSVKSISES